MPRGKNIAAQPSPAALLRSGVSFGHVSEVAKFRGAIAAVCDLSENGRLNEHGRDPLSKLADTCGVAVQTEIARRWSRWNDEHIEELGQKGRQLPDQQEPAQVLRFLVEMLGLDVHERPDSWAEVWLSFEERVGTNLGLHIGSAGAVPYPGCKDEYDMKHKQELKSWQESALQHLKAKVAAGQREKAEADLASLRQSNLAEVTTNTAVSPSAGKEQSIGGHKDWGPDFQEHLSLAEYILKRVSNNVRVLEATEREKQPVALQSYTKAVAGVVAADVRQWLEQLATLFSLYHVYLLDLENERQRLAVALEKQEAEVAGCKKRCVEAERRHNVLQEHWKEEKMRVNAEALLGVKAQDESTLVYSQADVDAMQVSWEKDQLGPILNDLQELRVQKEALVDAHRKLRTQVNLKGLAAQNDGFSPRGGPGSPRFDPMQGQLSRNMSSQMTKQKSSRLPSRQQMMLREESRTESELLDPEDADMGLTPATWINLASAVQAIVERTEQDGMVKCLQRFRGSLESSAAITDTAVKFLMQDLTSLPLSGGLKNLRRKSFAMQKEREAGKQRRASQSRRGSVAGSAADGNSLQEGAVAISGHAVLALGTISAELSRLETALQDVTGVPEQLVALCAWSRDAVNTVQKEIGTNSSQAEEGSDASAAAPLLSARSSAVSPRSLKTPSVGSPSRMKRRGSASDSGSSPVKAKALLIRPPPKLDQKALNTKTPPLVLRPAKGVQTTPVEILDPEDESEAQLTAAAMQEFFRSSGYLPGGAAQDVTHIAVGDADASSIASQTACLRSSLHLDHGEERSISKMSHVSFSSQGAPVVEGFGLLPRPLEAGSRVPSLPSSPLNEVMQAAGIADPAQTSGEAIALQQTAVEGEASSTTAGERRQSFSRMRPQRPSATMRGLLDGGADRSSQGASCCSSEPSAVAPLLSMAGFNLEMQQNTGARPVAAATAVPGEMMLGEAAPVTENRAGLRIQGGQVPGMQGQEFVHRMARVQAELERQLRSARKQLADERSKHQQAMQTFEQDAYRSQHTVEELRQRLVQLEEQLKTQGAGKAAQDAIFQAGLSDFMRGQGDVFERLYRDALDRMRRFAELQARHLEETSTMFLHTLDTMAVQASWGLMPITRSLSPETVYPQFASRSSLSPSRYSFVEPQSAMFGARVTQRRRTEDGSPGPPEELLGTLQISSLPTPGVSTSFSRPMSSESMTILDSFMQQRPRAAAEPREPRWLMQADGGDYTDLVVVGGGGNPPMERRAGTAPSPTTKPLNGLHPPRGHRSSVPDTGGGGGKDGLLPPLSCSVQGRTLNSKPSTAEATPADVDKKPDRSLAAGVQPDFPEQPLQKAGSRPPSTGKLRKVVHGTPPGTASTRASNSRQSQLSVSSQSMPSLSRPQTRVLKQAPQGSM